MLHLVGYLVFYDSINKIFIAKFAWNDLSLELARSLLVIHYGSSTVVAHKGLSDVMITKQVRKQKSA